MQENKQKNSPTKKRILQYLNIKNITKYQFYKNTSISRGTLDNDSGLTEENIAKCLAYYKDINPIWLLTGEGPMLRNDDGSNDAKPAQVAPVVEQSCAQCAIKDKLIESQQATIEAQRETINLLKQELKACGNSKKPPLPDTLPAEVTAKLKKD